jgi:hypothetical protein
MIKFIKKPLHCNKCKSLIIPDYSQLPDLSKMKIMGTMNLKLTCGKKTKIGDKGCTGYAKVKLEGNATAEPVLAEDDGSLTYKAL